MHLLDLIFGAIEFAIGGLGLLPKRLLMLTDFAPGIKERTVQAVSVELRDITVRFKLLYRD